MITLLLLAQITRDEFMDFKRQVEVQFAEIKGEIKELRSQIQALNQRIDDLNKKLNKRMDDLITYLWIFRGFIFLYFPTYPENKASSYKYPFLCPWGALNK